MGKLYVVDVRAEHWQDITLRAQRVLKEVPLIVAQDTNRVRRLLERCDIHTPLLELDERDTPAGLEAILDALNRGDVALVLHAVTEWTDLTYTLVRGLLGRQADLVPIPGPVAAITGLVMSGLPADRFTFLGVLTGSSQERRALLQSVARERHTLVGDALASRLDEVLDDIEAVLGDRRIAICHDQDTWRGRVSQAPMLSQEGRCTLVIQGAEQDFVWTEDQVREQVCAMLKMGESPRDVARLVALRSGWPKRKVYRIAISLDLSA